MVLLHPMSLPASAKGKLEILGSSTYIVETLTDFRIWRNEVYAIGGAYVRSGMSHSEVAQDGGIKMGFEIYLDAVSIEFNKHDAPSISIFFHAV